jgi:hypothetical protein
LAIINLLIHPLASAPISAYTLVAVTTKVRRAIAVIRHCIEKDHYALSIHFSRRMRQRGLFWPDVQAVIDRSADVRSQGADKYNRPKWIIRGDAAFGGDIEIVCAIEIDESEMEFITLYWEN